MPDTGLTDGQLKALLSLLDDEDLAAREHVFGRLREVLAAEPARLEGLRPLLEPRLARRLEALRDDVHWDDLETLLERMSRLPEHRFDLESAVHLLATFATPGLPREAVSGPLDEMAAELGPSLMGLEDPMEALARVRRFLFEHKGFKGNAGDYYDPDNTYFDKVLERRLGIPITLSCLYLLLGRRLSLHFVGVGLPGHFIVRFQHRGARVHIDPFLEGRLLSAADSAQILRRQGQDPDPRHLAPASHRAILARMIANLVNIYADLEDKTRAGRLTKLYQLLA